MFKNQDTLIAFSAKIKDCMVFEAGFMGRNGV
jgi:hypothetical protein